MFIFETENEMKKLLILAVTFTMALGGCATSYQPSGLSGGFTETQLDTNIWRVGFEGNGYTRGERAENLALLRSAELALANGFTHFALADSKTATDISSYTAPSTSRTTFDANRIGNSVSGTARTRTYGGDTAFISKPSANNTVVMFKGKPDLSGMIFDASFVCTSLGKKYEVVCNAPEK